MSIFFNKEKEMFYLHTKNSSYVFCVADRNILEHLYYGARIENDDIKYIGNRQIYSFHAHEDRESRLFSTGSVGLEVSPFNFGDFRVPSLVFSRQEGVDSLRLRYSSHSIYKGRTAIEGLPSSRQSEDCQTLEVVLTDDEKTTQLTLYYVVYEDFDVICRYQVIKNLSESVLSLSKFASACLDFYGCDFDVLTLEGNYLYERAQALRTPLRKGVFKNQSLVGISSHNKNPFFALLSKNTDENIGEAYGFNLVYSGNFSQEIEVTHLSNTRIVMGIDDTGFSWSLHEGESLYSPEAVMTYSASGIGGVSRNFHDHIRNNIIEKEFAFTKRPIVINSWEASYFSVNEDLMLSLTDKAKECGVDTVVLDDGWFRSGIQEGLGDWKTDRERFPNGLKGLADKIHQKGLKFGLWLEPEMVNPLSDFYKNDATCILSTSKEPLISRKQYVLDLTRDDVIERVVNRICDELDGVEIDYIKWDFNRYLSEADSYKTDAGEVYHRQTLGAYKLLSQLKERLGNVFFETCSGGGGRFDLGMMYYSPQIWTSDNTDPYARIFIEYGTSYAYPVSTMSCHFTEGVCTSGRPSSHDFRYRVAEVGSYGYELNLSEYGEEDIAKFREYSQKYREDEEFNLSGDLYRLISPKESDFCAFIKVLKDKSKAKFTFFELKATAFTETLVVKLKGLDAKATYENDQTGERYFGSTLMNVGIRINDLFRSKREDGFVIIFKKV